MAYTINKTDGNVLLTLQDGIIDTSTFPINLIGRNATNYGDAQNENFVRLMENFSDNLPPGQSVGLNAVQGMLWWNSEEGRLKVYDGADWIPVSSCIISATTPTSAKLGDQWWDTANYQLFSYTGTAWQLIGPGYTKNQGKSGSIVETIRDSNNQNHTVVNTYTNGNLISITSYDATFTPGNVSLYPAFGNISPGINLASSTTVNGTAANSELLGGVSASSYARKDTNDTFLYDVGVNGTLSLTNANLFYSHPSLIVQNKALQGNIEFYTNTPVLGNLRPLWIDGNIGQAQSSYPTYPSSITNKGYVDNLVNPVNARIDETNGYIASNISALSAATTASIGVLAASTSANLAAATSALYSNIGSLTAYTETNVSNLWADAANQASSISSLNSAILILNGLILGVNSNITVATTSSIDYTNATAVSLQSNIDATNAQLSAAIANSVSPLAPINSPVFTGEPRATTPAPGDSSTRIATTSFVQQATQGIFKYTVSPYTPSGGNNGDFWFQV